MFVSRRRKFYFGLQVTIVSDRQGLKLFAYLRLFRFHKEHEWLIRENPEWNADYSHLTPKAGKVTDLVEPPSGEVVGPEEISA